MNIDDEALKNDPLGESKKMVGRNAKLAAKAIAIAYLNNSFKIRILSTFLASYFLRHIKPSQLLKFVILINTMGNYGDFTNSIRLMYSARTTAPNLIEKNKKD